MSTSAWFWRVVELPLRRPIATLLAVLLVTAATAMAWPAVRFEPDVSRLLPADHPQVRIARLLDDRARPSRLLWILLAGDDLEAAVPAIAERLARSPLVDAVAIRRSELFATQVARAKAAPLWSCDDASLQRIGEALSPAGVRAAVASLQLDLADDPLAARELALRDPLGMRWLLDGSAGARRLGFAVDTDLLLLADRRHALLQVRGAADAFDADFSTELCEHLERVLAGRDYRAFGGYLVARADQQRIRADFERASTWSVVAIALYLCWVMRGLRLPLLMQLPALLSIVWAIPIGNLLFGPLPTVAVAAVAVLCGLGVDFAIHYAAKYRAARLAAGHVEAVRATQRATAPELLIDMATTAVTFLAIGAGTDGGLSAFGLLLALGLVGSVSFTILALPVLLRWSGDRADPERSVLSAWADRWLTRPAARVVAGCLLLAGVLGGGGILWLGVDLSADAESLRPTDDGVAIARAELEREVGFSTVPAVVLWPAQQDPSVLWQALVGLQREGDVRFWNGLERCDTEVGRAQIAALRQRIAGFESSAASELAAVGLVPAAFVPATHELAERLAEDPEPVAPTLVATDAGERRVVTIWSRDRLGPAAFAALERRLGGEAPAATLHGGPSLTAALEQVLRRDLGWAVALALLLAVVMVTAWLRSLRAGLLALVPSTLGLCATLWLLRLLGEPLSMVSFVAVPFILGIGVDEGVHLVGHFRHGARDTGATGVGVVRTSIGTVLGFGALLGASTPGLRLLGGAVAFGSICSMLACLFVLAPLLPGRARVRQGA